ncbi:GNAT family N-acetyltransferase [Amedibacillus sp. YH-ame6]
MIRETLVNEKNEVFDLWKLSYPTQNETYLKFYFDEIFDQGVGIVKEQDGKIVSSLQMNYHVFQFHGKQLKASYILGASTLPDYRRRGHMRSLMQSILDEASHNCLITLIKAFNPKVYDHFGFDVVYYRKGYTLTRESLHKVTTQRVSEDCEAKELLETYRRFIVRFDGYYARDIKYYETLLKELELKQKHILVYRGEHNEIQGYIIYQVKKNDVVVQEAIYMNSTVLKRLLKRAMGVEKEITVMVSSCERLERIFPLAIPKKQPYLMARINNYALFNKLYNVKVKNTQEAFELLKKPLWCHEYY